MDLCQSCGMPLQSEDDFGTNENGGRNLDYCRFCFQRGRFTDEGITMEEKIKKNIEIAKRMGMSEETARTMATTTIPHLKRWKK